MQGESLYIVLEFRTKTRAQLCLLKRNRYHGLLDITFTIKLADDAHGVSSWKSDYNYPVSMLDTFAVNVHQLKFYEDTSASRDALDVLSSNEVIRRSDLKFNDNCTKITSWLACRE